MLDAKPCPLSASFSEGPDLSSSKVAFSARPRSVCHRRPCKKSHRACIEHASGCIGHRRRHSLGVFGCIRASIEVHRPMQNNRADKNPAPRAFRSDRLHFETRPPFHCALCTGPSANDWSSYCTLWITAPTGMLLTVEGTRTGIPRECDQQGAVSTTSLPARGLLFTL